MLQACFGSLPHLRTCLGFFRPAHPSPTCPPCLGSLSFGSVSALPTHLLYRVNFQVPRLLEQTRFSCNRLDRVLVSPPARCLKFKTREKAIDSPLWVFSCLRRGSRVPRLAVHFPHVARLCLLAQAEKRPELSHAAFPPNTIFTVCFPPVLAPLKSGRGLPRFGFCSCLPRVFRPLCCGSLPPCREAWTGLIRPMPALQKQTRGLPVCFISAPCLFLSSSVLRSPSYLSRGFALHSRRKKMRPVPRSRAPKH